MGMSNDGLSNWQLLRQKFVLQQNAIETFGLEEAANIKTAWLFPIF